MMVFLFATSGKRKILAIGITIRNVEKLKEGKPIFKYAEEFKLEKFEAHDLMIFYGETEEEIYKELKEKGMLEGTKINTYGKPTKQ